MKTLQKYNIIFVIDSLGTGGAERSLIGIANHLNNNGHKITIMALSQEECIYEINTGINIIDNYPFKPGLLCIFDIRRIIKKIAPDIVISFLPTSNTLTTIALRFSQIPLIISDRCNNKIEFDTIRFSKKFKLLCKYAWRFADKFVVQTEGSKTYFKNSKFKIKEERIRVIENPVRPIKILNPHKEIKRPAIIGLGRFDERKGFHLLIDAFSRIANKYPEWNLVIHGYGDYLEVYKKQIKEYSLEKRIFLPGVTKDAYAEMSQGDIFVIPSFFEGFPNTLMEAMASGLPCIAFDFEYGARELISNNENGIIVPLKDVNKLTEALEELINNPQKRKLLGNNAKKVLETLKAEKIFEKWDQLIEETITGN
jgi:glycosyltransferase involved in cell wall biosynthesis